MANQGHRNIRTSSSETIAAEQVKAARALLAWSQSELATEAKVSPSTIADFERKAREPIANNLQAIRDALEARGLKFVAGGVVEAIQMSAPAPLRAGKLLRWINSTDLSEWGRRRDSHGGLPELARRLIYAALGPAADVRFPTDESIQLGGWDGICETSQGVGPIPDGVSGWEFGAQPGGMRGKATKDITKRSADPLGLIPEHTSFVFCTPHRFPDKRSWEDEQKATGRWRDVKVIDADDLVQWLELYPAVAQWLAVRISKRPPGLRNVEDVLAEWTEATQPPLPAEILTLDRDTEATEVLKWLKAPASLLSLQAEAPEEVIAFAAAALDPLPAIHKLAYWGRMVVADDPETARALIGISTALIVVLPSPDAGLAARLVKDGHHVLGAYGPELPALTSARRLERPWKHNLYMALLQAKLSEADAHKLSRSSGRSLTVLRRIMPKNPVVSRPAWAEAPPPELLAAMLAGAWADSSEIDKAMISEIAGRPYEDVEEVLTPLATQYGGPLTRSGSIWRITALRDVWAMLGPKLSRAMVERFETVFQKVLSARNLRFDRDRGDHWFEDPDEYPEEASGALRRGLAEAMIAFGVFPEAAAGVSQADRRADRAVTKLLDGADKRLWWSLSGDFQRLAEASPTAFLAAVEGGLEGDDPPITALFRSDEGMITPREYLADLLWALETLARSPDYLPRAALILAHLDSLDPGGKMGNRPSRSLRQILLPWSPQTYATATDRMRVVEMIMKRFPETGWRLLKDLAPRAHDTSGISPYPDWRDFAPDQEARVTYAEIAKVGRTVGELLLAYVGESGARWRELLRFWQGFDPMWRQEAAEQLEAYARSETDAGEREALRDALRDLILQHEGFAHADWAMPDEVLDPLRAVRDALQPATLEEKHRWVFQGGNMFFRPNRSMDQMTEELAAAQLAAAEELLAGLDDQAILAFARSVTHTHALGQAIERSSIPTARKDALMVAALRSFEGDPVGDFGFGMVIIRREDLKDPAWAPALWKRAQLEAWGEIAEWRIVHALPANADTWRQVADRSPTLDARYWKALQIFNIPHDGGFAFVLDKLQAAGREREAVAWLAMRLAENPPSDLLAKALENAVAAKAPDNHNDATMFAYYLGLILDRLTADPDFPRPTLVKLEWQYFQALRYSDHPPRTLHGALAEDPGFFVMLLKYLYKPAEDSGVEDDTPDDREFVSTMADQAWNVLHDWTQVPGSDAAGVIDRAKLFAWVEGARRMAAEVGRGDVADRKIGDILAAAQRQPDQPWPPEPVRDLIETLRNRNMEEALQYGLYNRRGVTTRAMHAGGSLERALAENYRRDALALKFEWPRTSQLLDRIAEMWEEDAKRHDEHTEQQEMF